MRRFVSLLLLVGLLPFGKAAAQDADCTIDVNPVLHMLLDAQTSSLNGDNARSLTSIAEAQRALLDIQTSCGLIVEDLPEAALSPFALTETYNAPNLYFGFDHPAGWTVGSFSGTTGYASLSLSPTGDTEEGEQINASFQLVVGLPSIIGSSMTTTTVSDLNSFVSAYLETAAASNSSAIGMSEWYTLDGRDAYRVGYTNTNGSGNLAAGIAIFLALQDGERILVLNGLADAGNELELLQLAEAIAVTVR